MADNVTLDVMSGGDTCAADDVGGVKYQRVKVAFGVDGAAVDASSTNPLPVRSYAGTAMMGYVNGQGYRMIAASSTATLGATGDFLNFLLITPMTVNPGQVVVKDISGSVTSATTVFAGGASSVATLVPFSVPLMAQSVNAAWEVTTSTNVLVFAAGTFANP